MTISIRCGDCRDVLPSLPDGSVHCVVTSPPYWGLRDYGVAGQLGMESSLGEYVDVMVAVFREVRRVLRDDGTLWLNLGDSYATSVNGRAAADTKAIGNDDRTFRDKPFSTIGPIFRPGNPDKNGGRSNRDGLSADAGSMLKPKDLCGIPWRVAFALQADGWYLRQDIIWSKPNPMPESVTDRCTKAHEYLFLLSKRERYYYDADAIREPHQDKNHPVIDGKFVNPRAAGGISKINHIPETQGWNGSGLKTSNREYNPLGRNKRSVWEVTTQPFSEAHFATFPPALIEPCIKAGTSERGCCGNCGKPWVRNVDRIKDRPTSELRGKYAQNGASIQIGGGSSTIGHSNWHDGRFDAVVKTIGWSPSCACAADPVPCTVMDPFGGAGTTGLVADRLQRNAILIELNPTYAAMSERRVTADGPLFADVSHESWAKMWAKPFDFSQEPE